MYNSSSKSYIGLLFRAKTCFVPCIHASNNIEELCKTVLLQERASNGTALPTSADQSKWPDLIEFLHALSKEIIRNMQGSFDVSLFPFVLVTHIENFEVMLD